MILVYYSRATSSIYRRCFCYFDKYFNYFVFRYRNIYSFFVTRKIVLGAILHQVSALNPHKKTIEFFVHFFDAKYSNGRFVLVRFGAVCTQIAM